MNVNFVSNPNTEKVKNKSDHKINMTALDIIVTIKLFRFCHHFFYFGDHSFHHAFNTCF
jgi:hypothetical protein